MYAVAMHAQTKLVADAAREPAGSVRARRRLRALAVVAFLVAAGASLIDAALTPGAPALLRKALLLILIGIVLVVAVRRLGRGVVPPAVAAPAALLDPLTGLPGLPLLEERLQRAITESTRDGRRVALILVDLDHFRRVNEAFGRELGDEVLRRLGRRIRGLLRDVDTVARVPGDEFALLARVGDRAEAELIVAKVMGGLAEPCELLGTQLAVHFDVGLALFPDHARDPRTLLQHAEVALDRAKESPERFAAYSPAEEADTGPDRLALLADLPAAVQRGELRLVYQPKRDLHAPGREAFEALMRWQHPVYGELEPMRFLPLAEQTGMITALTHWALDEALRVLAAAQAGAPERALEIAVNLSVRALDDPALAAWLAARLEARGVAASSLRLEVTESALMSDARRGLDVLRQVADLGVGVSLDDFGVGHSSLAYLARLPVDELKIDRGFVAEMLDSPRSEAIVRATIDLAHDLGLKVVAEGVEREEQVRALQALGCDSLQGHALGRPLDDEHLIGAGRGG
jgi:diguanylate cyclase (GGDEF)-like protein